MTHDARDTIFALASGSTRAAISVLRASGPHCAATLAALCHTLPIPRRASLRLLRDQTGAILDRALVLWLPGPATYTGEDSVEFHLHGGAAVLADTADALVAAGLRPAEPGEFTRRAFLNGRIDLLEAEATADLIEAETSAQRRQALDQLAGGLSELLQAWKQQLIRLLAQQEALIDFPDEDLPDHVEAAMQAELASLHCAILHNLNDDRRGERLRLGLTFAISGAPNAGKSTLINALAGRDVAIVSAFPGTTRDILEARVVLGGVPVTLLDTAGLRETSDPIEAEGVRRAMLRAAQADLVLLVGNVTEPHPEPPTGVPNLRVTTKVDLFGPPQPPELGVSAIAGIGLTDLTEVLASHARSMTQTAGTPPLTRPRHRAALAEAAARLAGALTAPAPELRAEDMRLALRAIGRITGHVGVEDILDSVFRQFCIGK